MRITRHFSLIDLSVATIVVVTLILPQRSAEAIPVFPDEDLAAIARAEARTFATPAEGKPVADLARDLIAAHHPDLAADAAITLTTAQAGAPTRWRSLLAASIAQFERLDVVEANTWAQRALDACDQAGAAMCPSWEQVRVQLYATHLEAGVRSGIDPRVDPAGFRRAAGAGIPSVRLRGAPVTTGGDAPAGSGSSTP